MQGSGLSATQVLQVRGYADQQLRNAKNPEDAANRRITVIVKYQEPATEEAVKKESKSPAAAAHE